MTVNVDNYKELTYVLAWAHMKNKWDLEQPRISIHGIGDISYAQIILEELHLNFHVIIDESDKRVTLYYAPITPIHADLSYDDWDDLFN